MAMSSTHNFYAFCDSVHREFFSALLFDWQEAGQMIDVEDAAVLLRVRSIGRSTENKSGETVLPCLFVLHAGGGVEKARISMDLNHWREWFGPEMRDEFVERLQAVQGLLHRRRDAEFAILEPAHLSGPTQQLLRDILVGFAHQSQESLGR